MHCSIHYQPVNVVQIVHAPAFNVIESMCQTAATGNLSSFCTKEMYNLSSSTHYAQFKNQQQKLENQKQSY